MISKLCVLFTGVEHLLRDVKDATISTLATEVRILSLNVSIRSAYCTVKIYWYQLVCLFIILLGENSLRVSTNIAQVGGKLVALKGLEARLKEIHAYLELVVEGKLPLNHEILYHLQVSLPPLFVSFRRFATSVYHLSLGQKCFLIGVRHRMEISMCS